MQTEPFAHDGRSYEVCHRNGEVLDVRFAVEVRHAMQPHVRRARVTGDRYYAICRAFRAARS